MTLRFISSANHGIIDYTAALALIASPFLLGLGEDNPVARWISVVTGFLVIVVSVATDYKFGLVKAIPFGGHLTLDLLVATAFMLVPYHFGLKGVEAAYYYANAVVVYLVVAFTAGQGIAGSNA